MTLLTPDEVLDNLYNEILEACSNGKLQRLLELEGCLGNLKESPGASLFLSSSISSGQFGIVRCLLRKGVRPSPNFDCVSLSEFLYQKTKNDVFLEIKGILLKYL